jgi:O-antigen/teichoic acid export membrane protein
MSFIKNMSYAISSNLISLTISTLVILVIPKLLGVEDYGYLQLYLFYCAYVGFLHLGWNDGIYLRYGGDEYSELDKKLFFSQFVMLSSSQILIGVMIWVFTIVFIPDSDRNFIIKMVAISMVIVNIRIMLLYLLQVTNRIREYARITMFDRVSFILLVIVFLFAGIKDYKIIILADLLGKLFSLIYSMFLCKEVVFNRITSFYFTINETIINISVGIKLMLANFASMLIIGIVRFGIERSWNISTFGKISLTLSISNLIMVFINAVGIIMFPVLRRTNADRLPSIYLTMKNFLTVSLFGLLLVYYPLKVTLSAWLPEYTESLIYMALLFPMSVYEGKMALLINTYLKTLRKEKMILSINILSVVLSFILTIMFTLVFKNLSLAVVSIVVLLAFRCIIAEVILSRLLNVAVYKDILLEIVMTLIFILAGWFLEMWLGVVIYLFAYSLYLLIKKTEIANTLKEVRQLIRG